MTFLPIVERELRLASRRKFTYWSRLGAAGFLLLICSMLLIISRLSQGMGISLGQMVFQVLKWMSFVFAASVGVFFHSDSLSEEKREGTLGLLFLTDLRGYDVVFGKVISQSLQSFYGLLAVFPILALPLLAGGVTGVEFWRTMLVLCNTLFFSLALGMFVSSLSREVMKAMNGALFLSLIFLVGLPWLDSGLTHWKGVAFKSIFSVASPAYLFTAAPHMRSGDYWAGLLVQHLIAWSFLAAACVIVPRTWQEKSTDASGLFAGLATRWRFGGKKARAAFRQKLLNHEPILWLALRDHWLSRFALAATVLVVGLLGWNIYRSWGNRQSFGIVQAFHGLLYLGVLLWIASQSCRFYLDAVRSGAMELILVTPMPPEQIVRSQWKSLWRIFWLPALILTAMTIFSGIESINQLKQSMAKSGAVVAANQDFINNFKINQIITMVGGTVNFVLEMTALAWFGMWMGLTSRKVSLAVLKTVVFVCVLPRIAQMFIQIAAIMLTQFILMRYFLIKNPPFWFGTIPSLLFGMAINVFFIVWSRKRLLTRFRETVSQSGRAAPRITVIPLPPPPPVISSLPS